MKIEGAKPAKFKEKKLLFAFVFLILLTLVIGLVGISRIQGLSRRIENLGKRNLSLEGAVLEMRVNNTVYAMGVRNYVFWRAARYLGAAPMAIDLSKILAAGDSFKKQLGIYQQNAYLLEQKNWAGQIAGSFDELLALGAKVIASVDNNRENRISDETNNLFMPFENRVYKIDSFLDTSMGKSNLLEVEKQVSLSYVDKEQAVLFLKLSLISALVMGILIAFAVYRRRIEEHLYRQDMFNRMINLEEDERKRLSNAVHDEMGQGLSALKIYLGLFSQELSKNKEATSLKEKIEECKKITSGLIEKSHNISFLLRPPDLDEVGLLESLESLLLESKHLTGVEYIFQKPTEALELSSEYSLLIYRITQELLTNMAKHSKAKNVDLSLKKNENRIELFYHDNGQGFDYPHAAHKFLRRQEDKFRLGLLGLKERVEVLDGVMSINSGLGKGMSVSVMLPI
ncbi:MAG: histidine kinase [Candidatus Omnitrophica bacterium]|nr:histidine kinase [Candidatus Omnitrophota bacterium]